MNVRQTVRSFRIGHWLIIFTTVVVAILVGIVLYIISDATRDRHDAMESLRLQQQANEIQRQATARRIDLLNERIVVLTDKVEQNALYIGQQRAEIVQLVAELSSHSVPGRNNGKAHALP
jgi:hypothetical protein